MMLPVGIMQMDSHFANPALSMERAETILASYNVEDKLLILPELAFTGYCFPEKNAIEPLCEDTELGPTSAWARKIAQTNRATVIVGFPEKTKDGKLYNSLMIVNPQGELVKRYQKTFLYESDEIWACEGPGFSCFNLKPDLKVGLAICMDLNPYKFEAPFEKFELANYLKSENARGLICSMAWRMIDDKTDETDNPAMDDETSDPLAHLNYWILRLKPLWSRSFFVVISNRVGREGKVRFCGNSCVISWKDSIENIKVMEKLGSREEAILQTVINDI